MRNRGHDLYGCGLVVIVALLLSVSFLTPPQVGEVAADSQEDFILGFERIAPPQAYKVPNKPRAESTGATVTLPPIGMQGGESPPGDPPFDPNVRVWGNSNEQNRPSMVIDPNNGWVYIAFQHFNGADWDILITRAENSSSPWSTPVGLADTTANEMNPSLAVTSQGTFVIAYEDDANPDSFVFLYSTDGNSWTSWTLNLSGMPELTQILWPTVVTQRVPGSYPDGIMFQMQCWCNDTANCDGGAHTALWVGEANAGASDPSGWSYGLGGSYWLVDATPGGTRIADPLHPAAWWGSSDYTQVMDEEVTDGTDWHMLWIIISEDGSSPQNGWLTNAESDDGIFGAGASVGQRAIVAGTFRLSSDPMRHQIIYFYTNDGWSTPNGLVLDSSTTDQRAISVTGVGTDFHVTYYSDTNMTDKFSDDGGVTMSPPLRVSDNTPSTAVNDEKSTSVYINATGGVVIAWQDNRDGDTSIFATFGLSGAPDGNDTSGPHARYLSTIPNPYVKNTSTSLKVMAQITDAYTGSNNITAAQLVLTDTSVSNPSMVDWTDAWVMNLTGYNRSRVETAWLWANDTAASWPVGSCHRFWIRGQDSIGNWGIGNHVDVCVVDDTTGYAEPPTLTKAELTGAMYADLKLTWLKSPNDTGVSGIVSKYKVWRSDGLGGSYVVVAEVPATGAASYSWTDAGAGHGDPSQFFYYLVANTSLADSSATRIAGKFVRSMSGAKQLVSFPLEQADYDPAVVFQTFDYIYVRTYKAGTPNPWWCHKPGLFISSLNELSIMDGYWVQMDGPGTMTVAGLVPENPVMELKKGWNMIGFPSFSSSYTFADLDTDIGGQLQLVEIYDPSAGPYYLQKVHRNAWASTYLGTGYAHMVKVSADVSWQVPG